MRTLLLLLFISLAVAAADRPNFVFILSDDQSWRGSSVRMDPENPQSKSDYYRTPNLERLFESGMRFTNGYAPAPYCCPTRRSIQIGQAPARHIYQKDQPGWTEYFKKQPNIPKALKAIDANYRTAHFGKWDHRFDMITPEDMGYDQSDGYTNNSEGGGKKSGGPAASDDPKLIGHITKRSCAFMADCKKQGKPFYVQLSHYAVHLDIFYKKGTLKKVKQRPKGKLHNSPEFAAMTEDMDEGIGDVVKKIKELGLAENTFIIFMSDNGGRTSLPKVKSDNQNLPLRNGKGTMYEGGIRVPFMISGPGIKPGTVSHVPVCGTDLLPTITDLAGKQLKHERLDGGSMKALVLGKANAVQRSNDFFVFHHSVTRKPQSAIRAGNYKLVKTWRDKKLELFDLSKDLGEKNDLSAKMPDKTKQLHEALVGYLNKVNATPKHMGSKSEIYGLWKKDKDSRKEDE